MNVTLSELERLTLISEEASEIIQLANKIIRFGFESYHPDDQNKVTNRELLEMECGHLMSAIRLSIQNGDLHIQKIEEAGKNKEKTINQYLRFNKL